MKLLKEKSREYNGKSYFKYKINIPERNIEESGFKVGEDLEIKSEKGKLILEKREIQEKPQEN